MKGSSEVMFCQSVTAAILCRTHRNPITGSALAQEFNVDIRKITGVIEDARDAGVKIASSKGGFDRHLGMVVEAGYYQAHTPEQMRSTYEMYQTTIKNLSARAKKMMCFDNCNPSLYEQHDEEAA